MLQVPGGYQRILQVTTTIIQKMEKLCNKLLHHNLLSPNSMFCPISIPVALCPSRRPHQGPSIITAPSFLSLPSPHHISISPPAPSSSILTVAPQALKEFKAINLIFLVSHFWKMSSYCELSLKNSTLIPLIPPQSASERGKNI